MSDERLARLESQIGRLLSIGVALSALALACGLVLEFTSARASASRVLQAGIILLIAIPITRILASFVDAVRASSSPSCFPPSRFHTSSADAKRARPGPPAIDVRLPAQRSDANSYD
jgi:MFS-type transporter involved in bile tolerance (Atg22 family)